jgi:hypothetical protein
VLWARGHRVRTEPARVRGFLEGVMRCLADRRREKKREKKKKKINLTAKLIHTDC